MLNNYYWQLFEEGIVILDDLNSFHSAAYRSSGQTLVSGNNSFSRNTAGREIDVSALFVSLSVSSKEDRGGSVTLKRDKTTGAGNRSRFQTWWMYKRRQLSHLWNVGRGWKKCVALFSTICRLFITLPFLSAIDHRFSFRYITKLL